MNKKIDRGVAESKASGFVSINCIDRHRSAKFYVDVLGATVDPDQDFNIGRSVYWFGDLKILLLHNAESRAADQFPHHAMVLLTLEVPDIQSVYRRALAWKASVIQPPDDDYSMLLEDPDGITIEVLKA